MSQGVSNLGELRDLIREFVSERDWEQFHTPKNLAMALAVEAGELMEHFQWLDDREARDAMSDTDRATAIQDEIGDVMIYLIRIADVLDVELLDAANTKLGKNRRRYPADVVRGSSRKAP